MFVSATLPLVLYMYKFVLNRFYLLLYLFLADKGSGCFVLSVGLYECTAHPGTAEQTLRLGGGGGLPLVTQYWGAQDTFSYKLFIILKILAGLPAPPAPRSLTPN